MDKTEVNPAFPDMYKVYCHYCGHFIGIFSPLNETAAMEAVCLDCKMRVGIFGSAMTRPDHDNKGGSIETRDIQDMQLTKAKMWIEIFEMWLGVNGYMFSREPDASETRTFMEVRPHNRIYLDRCLFFDDKNFKMWLGFARPSCVIPLHHDPTDPAFDPEKFFHPFLKYMP